MSLVANDGKKQSDDTAVKRVKLGLDYGYEKSPVVVCDCGWLGTYVQIPCANCGQSCGTWSKAAMFAVDCDCTLFTTGSRFRTIGTQKI